MMVLCDNQEDQQPYPSVPLNAVLDHSIPLGFSEYSFNSASGHSDRSKSNSAEEKVVSLVHSVKEIARKTEEAKAEGEAVEEKKKKKMLQNPNKSNGLEMKNHSWGQNLHEVDATITVPPGTKSGLVVCEMKKDHLKVVLKGEKTIIEGELFQALKLDECFWILEDNKAVCILMTKGEDKWWGSLLKGGPEIDTKKAEPELCEFSDFDYKTRSVVEKMMLDCRQKQLGLPTSDEIEIQQVQAILEQKFM